MYLLHPFEQHLWWQNGRSSTNHKGTLAPWPNYPCMKSSCPCLDNPSSETNILKQTCKLHHSCIQWIQVRTWSALSTISSHSSPLIPSKSISSFLSSNVSTIDSKPLIKWTSTGKYWNICSIRIRVMLINRKWKSINKHHIILLQKLMHEQMQTISCWLKYLGFCISSK